MAELKRKKNPLTHPRAAQRRADMYHPCLSFMKTVDGTINEIKARRTNLPPAKLRKNAYMLWLLPKIKPIAEYVAHISCHALATPHQLESYFRVLEKFGVDFTVLDDEMCCGWTALEGSVKTEDWESLKKAEDAAREFAQDNFKASKAKGARGMLCFCNWCLYTNKWAHAQPSSVEETGIEPLDYFAPVFERLDKVNLKLDKPTVIGYYEGCHMRSDSVLPGVEVDWSKYRQTLDIIKNAQVIDLPNTCCMIAAEKVIEQAKNKKVDVIVCSCLACWMYLTFASREAVGPPVKFYTTLLDEASDS